MGVISNGTTLIDNGSFENLPSSGATWDTTPKTATFTATAGEGYFCNTSGGAFTVNLPSGSAGNIVAIADYASTFGSNRLTVSPNGTQRIGGYNRDAVLNVNGQTVTFVYVDSTEGWRSTQFSEQSLEGSNYINASGGDISFVGNEKIHVFKSPGTFTVHSVSPSAPENSVSYVVAAGGGGGGAGSPSGGGGGAGGYREGKNPTHNFEASNLKTTGLTVSATSYPITVGAGGASGPGNFGDGANGSNSVFSTITAAGGGGGGRGDGSGVAGGSGGGAGGMPSANNFTRNGGNGNTPPVSPQQGNAGGASSGSPLNYSGGGGGGAMGVGMSGSSRVPANTGNSDVNGNGGPGAWSNISGQLTVISGGGNCHAPNNRTMIAHTNGRQGARIDGYSTDGQDNSGGGGCGAPGGRDTNGGSGIVIIRYRYKD